MGKRRYRQASEATKKKMSLAHLNNRHNQATKDLISRKMVLYWSGVPNDPFADHNKK